jgi:drug/metabolite transporter (DMT)-like permease
MFQFKPQQIFWLLLIGAVGLEIAADVLFKEWSMHHRNSLLIIGLFVYAVGTVLWAYSLRFEGLSKALVFFTLANLLVGVALGTFLYKEALTMPNKVGIMLALIAIALLES